MQQKRRTVGLPDPLNSCWIQTLKANVYTRSLPDALPGKAFFWLVFYPFATEYWSDFEFQGRTHLQMQNDEKLNNGGPCHSRIDDFPLNRSLDRSLQFYYFHFMPNSTFKLHFILRVSCYSDGLVGSFQAEVEVLVSGNCCC